MPGGYALLLTVGLLATHFSSAVVSLDGYIGQNDKARLQDLFNAQGPFKDPTTTYWALRGLSILKALPKDQSALCQLLKASTADTVENLFYITESAKLIKCAIQKTAQLEALLKDAVSAKKVAQIYYAVNSMSNLKIAVPTDAVLKSLDEALKTDDSPTSYGYAFIIYATHNMDVLKKHSLIEDIYAQADIVADKYMQFEGGLYTTALVVESSFSLAAAANKAPSLKPDQVVQLSNYLVSRKHVQRLRSAVQMLAALQTLADNSYFVPASISLESGASVPSTNTKVVVRVGNVMGDSLGKTTLTADSGKHIADSAVVLSKKPLTATSDPSLFELDFSSVKGPFGSYSLDLSLSPAKPDKRLVGLKASLQVQSVTDVKLDGVEVGVIDSEMGSSASLSKVSQPEKLSKVLNADAPQTVVMKFTVKSSSTNEALLVHQTFVRLTHKASNEEIIFVATPDETTKQYKFEMRVGQKARDFGSLSGLYSMSLVVGDAIVSNPIDWYLADIDLKFASAPAENTSGSQYNEKPPITHMFREAEKRPPAMVSNVFTVLVLAPFLIMLILWIKIGANISNLPSVGLSALGFHGSLAAIFFLYFLYWIELNMFDTITYLSILAIPTFLFGNRLLGAIADRRKAK